MLDGLGTVVIAKFLDAGVDGDGELTVEDAGAVFAIDVDVIFAEAGVDEIDDGFKVFVFKKASRAEDNQVKIENGAPFASGSVGDLITLLKVLHNELQAPPMARVSHESHLAIPLAQ